MATIIKTVIKSGIRYRVLIRRARQPVLRATFIRKADAEEWARREEADIIAGSQIRGFADRERTVGELIDRYIEAGLPGPKEAPQRKAQLLWWKERIGDLKVSELTPQEIATHRDRLAATKIPRKDGARPRSSSTIRNYLITLSHLFSVAKREWRWATTNPVSDVRKPSPAPGRVRFLSAEELRSLLDHCAASRYALLRNAVLLSVYTGMRYSEEMTLSWADVDLTQKVIRLNETKNGTRRSVPLIGEALTVIEEMANPEHPRDALLFAGPLTAHQPADISKHFEVACQAAGIADFRWHDLRHTWATWHRQSGTPTHELQRLGGWQSVVMVERYAHLASEHLASAANRLDAVFQESSYVSATLKKLRA